MPVIFSRQAGLQLDDLYGHIAEASGPRRAEAYVQRIVAYCESFGEFPERGTKRDDLHPGLRTIGFRRRVLIAFAVYPESVVIHGIFYGGQDYEAAFAEGKD